MKAVLFMKELGIKMKRIVELLSISKSTIYRKQKLMNHSSESSNVDGLNNLLRQRISEIALKYPFYGYRRIYALLRRKGILVNHKKVYRIYRELNLQRPKRKKKIRVKNSLIESMPALKLTKLIYPNAVWVTGFIHDSLTNNRVLRILIIQDAYTKKVVGYRIGRSITAEEVTDTLKEAISVYGKPHILHSDNGPEFEFKLLNSFLNTNRITREFIEKGKPYQNGIAESFMDKFRDECLNLNMFKSIEEAKEVIENYINFYNKERPHSSLNYKTPIEFERSLAII